MTLGSPYAFTYYPIRQAVNVGNSVGGKPVIGPWNAKLLSVISFNCQGQISIAYLQRDRVRSLFRHCIKGTGIVCQTPVPRN